MLKLIGLAAFAAALMAAASVEAAQPKRGVQGVSCGTLAHSIGASNVWRSYFRGARQGLFDQVWWYTSSPCFRSQADCKAWLYWTQSDWPYYTTVTRCHRGVN
jgi:hypothetical protein